MKMFLIQHFFNYEFVYIFLFCSLVFLIFAIFIRYKILKIAGIVFFSVFLGLSLVESTLSFQTDKFEFSKPYKNIFNKSGDISIKYKVYVEKKTK